jgi:hypothetical protein
MVITSSEKRYFHVDSYFRTSGTISQPSFDLVTPINLSPLGRQMSSRAKVRMRVINAQIPYSFYTVQEGFNKIKLSVPALPNLPPFVLSIPAGNYNVFSLIRAVKDAFTIAFGSSDDFITLTYSRVTNKISISHGFGGGTNDYILIFDEETLYEQLGFNLNDTPLITTSPIVAPNCVNVQPANAIYIRSLSLLQINTEEASEANKSGFSDILAKVPISVDANSVISYEPLDPLEIVALVDRINRMTFRLTDEDNRILDLNGLDWQMTIEFSLFSEGGVTNRAP